MHPGAAHSSENLSNVTLRVATYRGFDTTLLPAAGLDNFPYKVEFSEFNSGNLIAQAINANAIDIGTWSEIPLVFAAAASALISVVATIDGPTSNQAVVVPVGSPAHSIRDLRGKKVGYIRSTTAQYFLIRMLQQADLTLSDITPVALGLSEGLTALKSGSLDAWATYGYVIPMIEADGTARVLQSAENILSGHYFIGASPARLSDPAFVAAAADYINRLGKAYATAMQDKPRWAHILAPVIRIPEKIILSDLEAENRPYRIRPWTGADITSAHAVAKIFAEQKLLPEHIDLKNLFSNALTPFL